MKLHRYRGQRVVTRPPIPDENAVLHIPGVEVDAAELNLYSEVNPLRFAIPPLRPPQALLYPITHRPVELLPELTPTIPPMVFMELFQERFDRYMTARHPRTSTDDARLKEEIQRYAASLGFISGVTLLDRRFVSLGYDSAFPYDTVLVLGMEMRKEFLLEAPDFRLRRYPDYDIYRKAGWRVHRVANFIRRQGVSCSARVPFDGAVQYTVHAILAGLGELGAFGGVITPQFGPRQRWCCITLDAELPLDAPVDLGVAAFCDECLLCVDRCPAGAIPRERVWWRGVYKRKVNDVRCFRFFSRLKGCAVCINACPLHRFGFREVMDHYARTGEVLGREEILAEKLTLRKKTSDHFLHSGEEIT
ncbi:MAG: 4Fe-4S dicluster domain-containing protein [Actinomycetota bacterium]